MRTDLVRVRIHTREHVRLHGPNYKAGYTVVFCFFAFPSRDLEETLFWGIDLMDVGVAEIVGKGAAPRSCAIVTKEQQEQK